MRHAIAKCTKLYVNFYLKLIRSIYFQIFNTSFQVYNLRKYAINKCENFQIVIVYCYVDDYQIDLFRW